MNTILLSFLVFALLPATFQLGITLILKQVFRKPLPSLKSFLKDASISSSITVAVTLAISWVLSITGVTQSFFYRPSQRDYGQAKELGISPEDIEIISEDGTRLHAWYLKAAEKEGNATQSQGVVIHLHGSDRNITYTIRNSYWLTQHGFDVLALDYRGYGKSEGKPSQTGLVEDVQAAIRWVSETSEAKDKPVWLWGQSMGGQLGILAAAREESFSVAGVISEATYSTYSSHIRDKVSRMGPLWLIQWALWLTTSDEESALSEVENLTPVSLILVHGTADRGVAPNHSDQLYEKAGEPKELWKVDDAGHLKIFHDEENQRKLLELMKATSVQE